MGKLPLDTPRDRNATFEPQLIPKHQRRLAGFDEKILALYAKGMTTRDIQDIVKELYRVDISPTLISEITQNLDAEVKAWKTRRIDDIHLRPRSTSLKSQQSYKHLRNQGAINAQ